MKEKVKIWIEKSKAFWNRTVIKTKESWDRFVPIFQEKIWKDPKRRYSFLFVLVFTFSGLSYLIFRDKYSIDSSIDDPALMIPDNASLVLEVFRPEEFIEDVAKTELGRKLSEDGTFRKTLTLPELRKVSSILYLLEAKAGVLTQPNRLASLFDGPVAMALLQKSEWLVIGKASIQSKLGVSLLTLFQGEKIAGKKIEPPKPKPQSEQNSSEDGSSEDGTGNTHSADDFTDQFNVGSEKFGNLEMYQYDFGNESVYITVIGNFFLITNSKETLDVSLALASTKNNSSLGNLKGFSHLRKSAQKKENKLLFYAGTNSLLSPVLKPCFGNSSMGLLLGWKERGLLEGEVYRIGGDQSDTSSNTITPNLSKILPKDLTFAFYSETLKPIEVWKTLTELEGDWQNLSKGLDQFAESAALNPKNYFQDSKGVALSFHGLDSKNGMIYPRFGISLSSVVKDDFVLKSIFKVGAKTKENFQNVEYATYDLKQGGYYSPSFVKVGDWTFFGSDKKSVEETIATRNGNKPNQSDRFGSGLIEKQGSYPNHLTIHIPNLLSDLKTFYLYGASDSMEYSSKTIERDVQPILDKLKPFAHFSMSFGSGNPGEVWGKARVGVE
ncbi:hypothetical protein [Leptospira stimsonii]|uniref:hypothetical protein n=1 Tax=Leptospira stimsonii TaxID=2202203 RepID=UPI001F4EB9C6|nr:hypothetical protein [Leptospira stimsonii]